MSVAALAPSDEQITIARQTLAVAGVAFPAH